MKKLTALTLALLLLALTACSGTPVIAPPRDPAPPAEENAQPQPDLPADGTALKTGLALVPSLGASKSAGEEPGLAQVDLTLVAVTVDDSGVIADCVIDAVQAKLPFTDQGKLTADLTAPVPTKNQLGTDYGMGKYSPIGREWDQQAQAFAQYAVGKTVEELRGMALNEKGAPAEADLAASCTISVGGLLEAVAQAVDSARHLGAAQGDTLSLAAITSTGSSKDAGEEPGLAQVDSTVTAVTFRGEEISSCIIDAAQCKVNFDSDGTITTDITAVPLTKNQLGRDYGMHKASSIGKEWSEQAEAFAQYAVGKTVEEVQGIALNEKGGPADADLAASVTLNPGSFQQVLALAHELR